MDLSGDDGRELADAARAQDLGELVCVEDRGVCRLCSGDDRDECERVHLRIEQWRPLAKRGDIDGRGVRNGLQHEAIDLFARDAQGLSTPSPLGSGLLLA